MGKIYTSYFAKWREFPSGSLAFGITRFPPMYFTGINIANLAPSSNLLYNLKNHQIDEFVFKQKYIQELEDKGLTSKGVRRLFEDIAADHDLILCCYEQTGEFCHRHILAEWLGDVEEL